VPQAALPPEKTLPKLGAVKDWEHMQNFPSVRKTKTLNTYAATDLKIQEIGNTECKLENILAKK
jgi:hypothetical protein